MSDTPTPRTDKARREARRIEGLFPLADECAKLEAELAAANDRICRLTEAGDEMARQFCHPTMQTHQWTQAKEAKP